ncbi:MAG: hypothetical protein IJY91_01510 [Oscillospiraceae bacterium]|nr:hypothetical protein [Oscillospiraceae bacterium]
MQVDYNRCEDQSNTNEVMLTLCETTVIEQGSKRYKNIVSLGHFCSPAIEFKKINRRRCSLPFDWLITPHLSVVMELINNNFMDFLSEEYMFQHKKYPAYYRNIKWDIDFYHDFSPFKRFQSQFQEVSEKYNRRIERFYSTIKQPTLFLRYVTEKDIQYILDNYELILETLKNYNCQNYIVFVANKEVSYSHRIPSDITMYFVEKDSNDEVSREFLNANDALIRYILENVEYATPHNELVGNKHIDFVKKLYRKIRLKLRIVYRYSKQC